VGHEALPGSIGDLLWPVLNFAVFTALIVRFAGGPFREFFRARSERLHEALAAGARARAEADALRAQIARDVADLPAQRERLKAELRATAAHEREQLLTLARQTADHIREDARLVAAQEVQGARESLRAEVIDEAVREATVLLRAALKPDDQERFVREFTRSAEELRS
jgi:F-type H+-transporting ATPase subunit b